MGVKKQQALSAAFLRTAAVPRMYADGNGLNLKVEDSGAKRWVQQAAIGGRRSDICLGGRQPAGHPAGSGPAGGKA